MMTSIIILTYNSEKYIKKLIESIFDSNKSDDYEIIVVDNDSIDKTVEEVSNIQHPTSKINIYETGANLGFAKGINYGAQRAKGDFLLFVNPDAVWKEGSLENFISVFQRYDKAGIVGGKMLTKMGISEMSVGKYYGFWTSLLTAFGLDEVFGFRSSPSQLKEVESVSGGFMMVKKDVFEKLSGFDEHYFMYIEDSDLCYRAGKHGYITYFTPEVAIIHQGQGSSNKAFAFKNIIKGILYFQKKHVNFISFLIIKFFFILKAGTLVLMGKLLNNKNLVENYSGVLTE